MGCDFSRRGVIERIWGKDAKGGNRFNFQEWKTLALNFLEVDKDKWSEYSLRLVHCLPTSLYTSVYPSSTAISFVIILFSSFFKVGALREEGLDTKYN